MATKSSTQAILALMMDAQKFKMINHWRKTTVEIYSDYIEAEYRITETVRTIPENKADEWRMFASGDELVLVLTYCYEDDTND